MTTIPCPTGRDPESGALSDRHDSQGNLLAHCEEEVGDGWGCVLVGGHAGPHRSDEDDGYITFKFFGECDMVAEILTRLSREGHGNGDMGYVIETNGQAVHVLERFDAESGELIGWYYDPDGPEGSDSYTFNNISDLREVRVP